MARGLRGARVLLPAHRARTAIRSGPCASSAAYGITPARGVSRSKLLVAAVILVAIAAFFASGAHRYLSFDNIKAQQGAVDAWYRGHPWQALAVFFLLYVAVTGLSLPGAAVMTLAAGA